jgi:3-methyladenine DNA glycosylase/8-oxoguanine DNA glycosylase
MRGFADAATAHATPTVTPDGQRRWRPGWPVDLATTLAPLAHGPADPTIRIGPGGAWRATRTPEGPATVHYCWDREAILVRAWGPGAERAVDEAPRVLGGDDDPTGFAAGAHPVMAAAFARYGAGWRVLRTGRVLEALVPAILEQRVTGREAAGAWVALVRRFGEPAPRSDPGAPRGLAVPPDGPGWARVASWDWHRAGVDPGRAATIVTAAGRARALEELGQRSPADAAAALRALPGIGAWTAAEVAVRAWGDIDAVSFGDFHLARHVVHALTGRRDGTDEELAELLTPWAGQRARAVRMLDLHAPRMPRHGPRATITDHRRH